MSVEMRSDRSALVLPEATAISCPHETRRFTRLTNAFSKKVANVAPERIATI
jgi:hypothetical protein